MLNQSSKRTPCPVCGRTKDADCRWSADIIFCHQGNSKNIVQNMRVGDVIQIEGRNWALVKINGGFSGMAAIFKPDRGKSTSGLKVSQIKAIQTITDQEKLEHELRDFKIAASVVLDIPPFEQLLDTQIKTYRDNARDIFETAKKIESKLSRLANYDNYLKQVLIEFRAVRRDIQYQLKDLDLYCKNPGQYWEAFIL